MGKKKSYTAEFKARVALDCIRGNLTINEISTKYKVHVVLPKNQAAVKRKSSQFCCSKLTGV